MSLKEQTKEIYRRYGLSDGEFQAYLVFLTYPQFTVSEVAGLLEFEEPSEMQVIADKLESLNFIRKIPGIIDRYIPLEPYLELFTKESEVFRNEITKIKDNVLTDQSVRFESLDKIENTSTESVTGNVKNQIDAFFKESDANDVNKSTTIENARSRFDTTSIALMAELQNAFFQTRDTFTTTRNTYTDSVKEQTHKSRDRFESTSKSLETDLHKHLDDNDAKIKNTINTKYEESSKVLDNNTSKFTNDNTQLNSELTAFSSNQVSQTESLEKNLHNTIDSLNSQLKLITENFKSKYDGGIKEQKDTLNQIIDDLLKDFADRVSSLEIECKKELDEHVEHHKEHGDSLKPTLDEILDKYLLRMKKVVDELKNKFSDLLNTHVQDFNQTSTKLRDEINSKLDSRHTGLAGQVLEFKKSTIQLMENLRDTSDTYDELAESLAKRGSAWKALLFGKHKKFVEKYDDIKEKISTISDDVQANFEGITASYIQETAETTNLLKSEVISLVTEKNKEYKTQTDSLDKNQKESLEAELEGLAGDLSKEIYGNIEQNINHCKDTTVKLKDDIENSLHSHHEEYDVAINKYRQNGLKHNDNCNTNVSEKINEWYALMDKDHNTSKIGISSETSNQIKIINDHLAKTTEKNNVHSNNFARDVKEDNTKLRTISDDLIRNSNDDFRICKNNISELITNQTSLFRKEIDEINEKQQKEVDDHIQVFKELIAKLDEKQHADLTQQKELVIKEFSAMEESLHAMLEKHKAEYQENATNLEKELTKSVESTIQDTKDTIADFTLNFMNEIDSGYEKGEENEEHLTAIKDAGMAVSEVGENSTWHVFGVKSVIEACIAAMQRTKSTITIVTPTVEPKILEALSQIAYMKKSSRFLYTTSWDMATFGDIVKKMKVLGNIQFRNLKNTNDFYAVSRDGEEIVLCPKSANNKDVVAIVSVHEGYAQIFGSFIYPIFQANSRPI